MGRTQTTITMAGKDTKFKKQYIITLEGVSKLDKVFGDNQTFMENIFDDEISIVVRVYNKMHKTTKATLEIKKIK